jgi:OMF family outer membrane factor
MQIWMQKFGIVLTITLWLLVMSAQAAENYTLEQCESYALQHNPAVQKSEESFKKVESQISEAWGSALPSVSLQAKYEYIPEQYSPFAADESAANPFVNSAPFIMDPSASTFDPATASLVQDLAAMLDFSDLVQDYSMNMTLAVSQIIFAQGKISTGLQIAETYQRALKAERQAIEQKIRLTIRQQFYQVLLVQEAILVLEEAQQTADKHVKQVESMFNNGLVRELDYLRAQLQVEDLHTTLDKMRKDARLALNALKLSMGMPGEEEIALVGKLQEPTAWPDIAGAYEQALQKRPELKQLSEAKQIQEHLVSIEKAEYLPLVYGGAAVTKLAQSNEAVPEEWHDDIRLFVGMQWNLFNGLQNKQRIVQAQTDVTKVSVQQADAKRGIRLQVNATIDAMQEARKRLDIRKKMSALAEKALKIATVSYESGQATQLDVLDANVEWKQTHLAYLEAMLDANVAINNFLQAVGSLK